MAPRKSATEAKKEEVKTLETEAGKEVKSEALTSEQVKKYRCDFKSWKEYNEYKGPKG